MAEDNFFPTNASATINTTSAENVTLELLPLPLLFTTVVLVPLVMVVAVVGNVLIIASYCMDSRVRNVSNMYLLHLAICDLLQALGSMPVYLVYTVLQQTWILGKVFCKVFLVHDHTLIVLSGYLIVLISQDELLILRNGIRYYRNETKAKASVKLAITWSVAFLTHGPAIVGWDHWVGYSQLHPYECKVEFFNHEVYTVVTMAIEFVVPGTALIILNCTICWEIHKLNRLTLSSTSSTQSSWTKSEPVVADMNKLRQNTDTMTRNNRLTSSSAAPRTSAIVSAVSSLSGRFVESDTNERKESEAKKPADNQDSKLHPDPITKLSGESQIVSECSTKNNSTTIQDVGNNGISAIVTGGTNIINTRTSVLNKTGNGNKPENVSDSKRDQTFSVLRYFLLLFSSNASSSSNAWAYIIKNRRYHKKGQAFTSKITKSQIKKDLKAARTLFMFVFAFLILWSPFSIATTVIAFCGSCVNLDVYEFFIWFLWIKTALDPILYASNNARFKRNIFKILGRVCICCSSTFRAWSLSVKVFSDS